MLISYAHLFSLGNDSVYFINAGLQAGISYRKIDFANLTFDNQFNGDIYTASLPTGEQFDKVNYSYPEFNAGLEWMAIYENTICTAGFSIQHLNRPDQSFMNESVKLPMRSQFSASVWLRNNDMVSYIPSIIFLKQQSFSELTGGLEIKIDMKKDAARNYAFGAACHFRVKDAIIPGVSLYYNQWRLGLSYDVNTSGFKEVSNGRGGQIGRAHV